MDSNDSFTRIAPYYDQLMASVPYRFWASYIEALWKTHGLKPRRLLDVACGTGTVAFLFADKGMEVVGVDLSPEMIGVANQKAQGRKDKPQFIAVNAAEMTPIRPPVDTAICLFDSLNNILDIATFTNALRNIRDSLTDHGLFIFDLNTAYAFRQGMFNQRSAPLDSPLSYIWRSKYNEHTRLCTVTMEFEIAARGDTPAAQSFTEIHIQRAYNRVEVDDMLTEAGFVDITTYDAYSLLGPKKRSDRIFWVAR